MGSSPRSLDLRVMYCKDLKAFNFFQKLSVYAVVSLVSDNPSMMKQQQRTPTDTEGDGNPEWNHQMRFNLGVEGDYDGDGDDDDHHLVKKNHHHLFLHFDMRTELAIFGDKSVGEVRVPLKDVINREEEEEVESSDGIIRFVSYEVRTSDGKPNGVLSFSYKVLNECNGSSSPEKKKKNAHIDSYPILNHINHHHNHNHFHYPSLLPDDYLQIPSGSGSGQSQESYYSATAVDASPPPHRVHYPSLEIPYPPPPPPATEEDYRMNYPQPHDQLHFHYPPPPPPPPPPLISRPPFPPPHLHLPPHAVQGAIVYYPQLYEHPYPN